MNKKKKKKKKQVQVIVSGATGFIGQNLIPLLIKKNLRLWQLQEIKKRHLNLNGIIKLILFF